MEANFRTDMKIPTRRAPPLPGNMNNDKIQKNSSAALDLMSLGNDPFNSQSVNLRAYGKKKAPPRPPPPKLKTGNQNKASGSLFDIFGRSKETSRGKAAATAIVKPLPPISAGQIPVDSLIDFHSPSSSPTFSKPSSGGLIRSNSYSKSSHIESGFEDDFDSFVTSTATTPSSNDPFSESTDSFSPVGKFSGEIVFELSNEDPKAKRYACVSSVSNFSKPTIIRPKAKPARPPPPKVATANTAFIPERSATPVRFTDDIPETVWSSPPMPTVPPPPPPPEVVQVLLNGPQIPHRPQVHQKAKTQSKTPYCIAEYDYEGTHDDDLSFKAGDVITLCSEVNSDWLKGKLSGKEGIFPSNYVNVVVPIGQEEEDDNELNMTAIALYTFRAETWDDLDFQEGEEIRVLRRINEDWLYGECNGRRGQFPENYVQDITTLVCEDS